MRNTRRYSGAGKGGKRGRSSSSSSSPSYVARHCICITFHCIVIKESIPFGAPGGEKRVSTSFSIFFRNCAWLVV
eukprot:scaffold268_cov236-Pinguiococcus_pyrenoidosus.AAC.10